MLAQRQLTAEQRIQKAVVDILHHKKATWMAGLIMIGKREVRESIPPHNTAATNGRDEFYCRGFVDSLTDPELRGLMLHENYHKLYKHLTTWQHLYKKDADRANRACDYVINLKIQDEFGDWAKLPEGGCVDEKYRGMDEARVFHALDDEDQGDGKGKGKGKGEGAPLDHHDWDDAAELSDTEKQELAQEIDKAIRQGSMLASKGEGDTPHDLDQMLKPKIDWRAALREFVAATCNGRDLSTYRRLRRRTVGQELYLPSTYSETVGELLLAVDTSGSMSDHELQRCLSEVKGICDVVKPERVRLLYWDGAVERDETYEQNELDKLERSTRPTGGGGTDVRCVVDYMRDKQITPQAVVVFTDGYLPDWGTWKVPVLWCITNNTGAHPNCGKVLHVDTNDI
jgi:predicted metal-dependent peptidase